MGVDGGGEVPADAPPLPRSIWVVAWASLSGQALVLAWQGPQSDEASLVLSLVVGAPVMGYISAGVVRARTVRLVLAWIVLVISLVAELIGLLWVDQLDQAVRGALSLATTAVALAGLSRFRHTDWYAWQRTRPPAHEGAPIGRLVAIGVLVGVLGGLSGPVDSSVEVRISVGGR